MRLVRVLVGSVAVCCAGLAAFSGVARAQDSYEQEAYPRDLIWRPLVLAPGMIEVLAGARSNIFAERLPDEDAEVAARLEAAMSFLPRLQMGIQTETAVTPDFELKDGTVYLEYNVMPSFSARGEVYINTLDPDLTFGFRVGVPIKFRVSSSTAIVSHPRFAQDLSGREQQFVELPVGAQLQIIPSLALFTGVGVQVVDFDFSNENVLVPFRVGVLVSPTRLFDVGAEFLLADLTGRGSGDYNGFDDRWVMLWVAMRR